MKQEDLTALQEARSQSDLFVFHRLFFDGLLQHGWAFQTLSVDAQHYDTLQTLIKDWVAQATRLMKCD